MSVLANPAAAKMRHHIDQLWCDKDGVYVTGWAHCEDEPVVALRLRSGERVACAGERTARPDVRAVYPALPDDACGFACYLACPPFRPVMLEIATRGGTGSFALDAGPAADVEPDDPETGLDRFTAEMKRIGGTVVELGARAVSPGATLRRGAFAPECPFIGVDIHAAPGVDLVADAHALSDAIVPGSVDGVFSLAVLEHLAAPWLVAAEVNRVLRIGGLTHHVVPQSWPIHEMPNDFWRMSDEGLKVLFGPALGFEVLEAAMATPVQMIPHPSLRKPPYLEFPFARGMAGASITARKVAEIAPDAVTWPLSRAAFARRSRTYPAPHA